MKKILLMAMVSLSLFGCSAVTTMTPAQFNQLPATALPFSGNWSGMSGNAVASLRLNAQGQGKLCMDNQKEVVFHNVKLMNDALYTDQGLKFKVKQLNNQNANLSIGMLGVSVAIDMQKDDPLLKSTLRCKQGLNF